MGRIYKKMLDVKNPKVIVLILTYNGKDLLDDCVSSYLNNDYQNFEVIVIDNNSSENIVEYVNDKWPEVEVLRTDVDLKYSGGFNFGLEYAFKKKNAEYVLISNNDVKADKGVIKSCAETAKRHEKVAFVTGKVYYFDNPSILQTCGKKHHPIIWSGDNIGGKVIDESQYEQEIELEWCDDVFWLVSKDIYMLVGGYNTLFAYQSEDFEWQVRAKKEGYKIYYSPKAKIWHKESMTLKRESPLRIYNTYRNPIIVILMHSTRRHALKVLAFRRKQLIRSTFVWLVKLKVSKIFYAWKGYCSAIRWGIKNDKISVINYLLLRNHFEK